MLMLLVLLFADLPGVLPACAEDLKAYIGTPLGGNREVVYCEVAEKADALKEALDNLPGDGSPNEQARYCVDTLKPAMATLREVCDEAEGLIKAEFYPYPKYREMLFDIQTEDPHA